MKQVCTAALCCIAVFLLHCYPSYAALQSSTSKISPESTWNPNPARDDLLIPLPCGQQMALRAVAVPAGDAMQDRAFSMGIAQVGELERQIYERRFDAYIAAPFSRADLPKAWQKQIPDDGAFRYYMLGKYEVSEYQWNAVMNEQCPPPPAAGANLPKRDISWYEMTAFLHRLNLWLLKNAPQSLPTFKDNPRNVGFLRLPTEEEWEFAAKGGVKVPEERRNHSEIFPLGGGQVADFGIFSAENGIKYDNPLPIGSRKPNPLGLYDTVGNVKELIQSFFRFSVADQREDGEIYRRLHGSAGGMLCKGGSFMSKKPSEVFPGCRDEIPLFTSSGEGRQRDMGFRVALSGINVPSGQRLSELVKASAEQPTTPGENAAPEAVPPAQTSVSAAEPTVSIPEHEHKKGVFSSMRSLFGSSPKKQSMDETSSGQRDKIITLNASGDPIQELDRITDVASHEMRTNLNQLRGLLEDQKRAEARRRELAYEKNFRSLLYQAESLRSIALRYWMLNKELEELKAKHFPAEKQKPLTEAMKDIFSGLITALSFYRTEAENLAPAPEASTKRIYSQLSKEYQRREEGEEGDMFTTHMRDNLSNAAKHINLARQRKLDAVSDKTLLKEIIPDLHFKALKFEQ